MPEPQYVTRSYAGGANANSALVQTVQPGDLTFTITPTTGWVEDDGSPLGTSGPFTVALDRFTPGVEKVLCSAIDLDTGLVTVYQADDGWTGRGYDGTTAQSHVPGAASTGVQPVWSAAEAKEANQAVVDVLGEGGLSALGVPIGSLVDFAGTLVTIPDNFLHADGSAVSRDTYSALFSALTVPATGTTTTSGATITGVDPSVTAVTLIGFKVTGANLTGVHTVLSTTSTTITLTSGTGVAAGTGALVIYPHGAGDGSTTFNLPDTRGRGTRGSGGVATNGQPICYVGQTGGVQSITLTEANLPALTKTTGNESAAHDHQQSALTIISDPSSTLNIVTSSGTGVTIDSGATQTTSAENVHHTHTVSFGGGGTTNVDSPYIGVLKMIRAT